MRNRPLLTYFVLVFAITWSIAGVAVLHADWFNRTFGPLDSSNPAFFVAVYAPTMLSVLLTAAFEGRAGLGRLLSRLDPRRCHPGWYVAVVGGFFALTVLTGWAGTMMGGPTPVPHWAGAAGALGAGLLFDPGPLGEELGWRGFALPRMLARWKPATASIILGVIWGLWHLPAFYVSTLSQSQMSLPIFLLGAVSLSVVTCWFFLKSKGSVLIAILCHLMANHANDITGSTFNQMTYGLAIVAGVLIVAGQLQPEPAATIAPEARAPSA